MKMFSYKSLATLAIASGLFFTNSFGMVDATGKAMIDKDKALCSEFKAACEGIIQADSESEAKKSDINQLRRSYIAQYKQFLHGFRPEEVLVKSFMRGELYPMMLDSFLSGFIKNTEAVAHNYLQQVDMPAVAPASPGEAESLRLPISIQIQPSSFRRTISELDLNKYSGLKEAITRLCKLCIELEYSLTPQKIATILLDNGLNPNATDEYGHTLLFNASRDGCAVSAVCTKVLLAAGGR